MVPSYLPGYVPCRYIPYNFDVDSLFPVQLSKFEVVTDMTAQVSGALTVSAELTVRFGPINVMSPKFYWFKQGHVDSGAIPLLNVGVPGMLTSHDFNYLLSSLLLPCILGFDFPEILTVGPSFQVCGVFMIA